MLGVTDYLQEGINKMIGGMRFIPPFFCMGSSPSLFGNAPPLTITSGILEIMNGIPNCNSRSCFRVYSWRNDGYNWFF